MVMPDWLRDYGAVSVAALAGSVTNGGRWVDVNGNFSRARAVTELATAVSMSVGLMAVGEYTHVDLKVLCGLGVLGGWLGPKTVADWVLKKWFGGTAP